MRQPICEDIIRSYYRFINANAEVARRQMDGDKVAAHHSGVCHGAFEVTGEMSR